MKGKKQHFIPPKVSKLVTQLKPNATRRNLNGPFELFSKLGTELFGLNVTHTHTMASSESNVSDCMYQLVPTHHLNRTFWTEHTLTHTHTHTNGTFYMDSLILQE